MPDACRPGSVGESDFIRLRRHSEMLVTHFNTVDNGAVRRAMRRN